MLKKVLLSVIVSLTALSAQERALEKRIGQMLMVGFHGTQAPKGSQICKDIQRYDLGAVILFDYNPVDKNRPKNIATKNS